MAHDGSSDDESAFLDAQEHGEDSGAIHKSGIALEAELSPVTSPVTPHKPSSPASSGRSKAVSAAVPPVSLPVNRQDADGSDEASHASWDAQRRTQSTGNLRVDNSASGANITANSAVPARLLTSPAHSESALRINNEKMGVAPPPPPISVRGTPDIKSNGFVSIGGNFLAGMADLAGLKSPRGAMQKVHVVYPEPGPLFVDLYSRDDGTGARVKGFRRKPDGSMADAEASGRVFPGDFMMAINGVDITKMVFAEIISTARDATFPLTLLFHCYQINKEEHEKLMQEVTPMERKYSSGPFPPPSPSNGWSARLSQMTRSGSFDQKTSNSSLANGAPKSPSSHSTTSEASTAKFGISMDKVRNSGTDGVKSLFRIMGNKASRPEEDRNVVKGWMNDLILKSHSTSGGRHRKTAANANTPVLHSTPIMAVTTGGRFVGVLDEDVNEFGLTWFRKTLPDNEIRQIKGVKRCPYFPSVDDVGAVISLQCESLRFSQFKRVVEMPQPLVLDPAVGTMVDVLLDAGAGSFSATLASNEHDTFQIKMSTEDVTLVKISEKEDEGGVVVTATYSSFLQILLDPADQLRFTLKVQEFGGFLGNREGDVCDLKNRQTQLKSLSCFFLVAQNRQHRDILTLLIRKFRARVLTSDREDLAQADERSLFMDPAFVVTVAPPPVLAASQSVGSTSGTISPASNSGTTGEKVSSTASPTTVTTPVPPSPGGKTLRVRLQSEHSFGPMNTRLSDLVGLEPDETASGRGSDLITLAATPPRSAMISSKNGFGELNSASNGTAFDNPFVEGRLAAQDKEIVMLREKLTSTSVLLKSAEQQKKQISESLEVKDNRIELQVVKIRQLEKFQGQCDAQAREIQNLRAKLEDEERQHTQCRKELQVVSSAAVIHASEMQDQGVQTEAQFLDGDTHTHSPVVSGFGLERDAWFGTVPTVTAADLQQQIKDQQVQIAQLQDEQVNLVAERNMFRAKSTELSRELRKLLVANNNRSLDDLETQLAERSGLQTELTIVKAEAKRSANEVAEMKGMLDSVGDKDKGAKRLAAQNLELQRTIHQLQDSLNESRDQVDAVKQINSALASRLHRLQPDTRGSRVDLPPISPVRSLPDISSDESDDDEEEDEELQDGIAAFRRSLVGNERYSH